MNIRYVSEQYRDYYSVHRRNWEDFYESERYMFDKIFKRKEGAFNVLDVGCGCGGLGEVLEKRYNIGFYQGVDINENEINWANYNSNIKIPHVFTNADIAEMSTEKLFDAVISLSCVDFNIDVLEMIKSCWDKVNRGGVFMMSARLTNGAGVNDIRHAYQKTKDNERANYVIFNWRELLTILMDLKPVPDYINAYGYWGKPAEGTVCEYGELCFSMLAVRKALVDCDKHQIYAELRLPADIYKEVI